MAINAEEPRVRQPMSDTEIFFRLTTPLLIFMFLFVGGAIDYFALYWFKYCFWKVGPLAVHGGEIDSTHNDPTIFELSDDVCGWTTDYYRNKTVKYDDLISDCCPHACTYLKDCRYGTYIILPLMSVGLAFTGFALLTVVNLLKGLDQNKKKVMSTYYMSILLSMGFHFASFFIWVLTADFCDDFKDVEDDKDICPGLNKYWDPAVTPYHELGL